MRKYDAQIKELRAQGKLYREIEEIVGCNKTTIGRCLDPEYDAKRAKQAALWRKSNPIYSKCNNFNKRGKTKSVTPEQLLSKFGDSPTCQLTGTPIDWKNLNEYSLDHKIPASRGGKSTIDNCQVTTKIANQMKGDLLTEELLGMCKKILVHHGYTVDEPKI